MSDEDFEKRIRGLENKVWIATGAAVVFSAWFGIANLYYIPNAVQSAVDKTTSGETEKDIKKLFDKAQIDYEQVTKISQGGTLTVGGICFKPRTLTRCARSISDHMTWVDNAQECKNAGMTVEQSLVALVQCD